MKQYTRTAVYVGRFPTGRDLLRSIHAFCVEKGVQAGHISIMGALKRASLGWYDLEARKYSQFEIEEPTEILHCTGNISLLDGRPFAHVHAVLSHQDRPAIGGHVFKGCEIFVAEYQILAYEQEPLQRGLDEQTGLMLWPADP